MMTRKWARGGWREIKEQKLHLRAPEMWRLENLFTPSQITAGLMGSLRSLRYKSVKGICLWFSYWMPALFSTVCGTPLLLATARLTDGEREQTREEITCLHVSYAEEVTKLANQKCLWILTWYFWLSQNIAQKMWGRPQKARVLNTPHILAWK